MKGREAEKTLQIQQERKLKTTGRVFSEVRKDLSVFIINMVTFG